MRHQSTRPLAGYVDSTTVADLPACDVRRLSGDELISELADLEARIQLLDRDVDGVFQHTMHDLVEAEYRILRELRRRHQLGQRGLRWTSFLRPETS